MENQICDQESVINNFVTRANDMEVNQSKKDDISNVLSEKSNVKMNALWKMICLKFFNVMSVILNQIQKWLKYS